MESITKVEQVSTLVRPILTMMFGAGVLYGFINGLVSADAFLGIAGSAIGYWFSQRTTDKERRVPSAPTRTDTPGGGSDAAKA